MLCHSRLRTPGICRLSISETAVHSSETGLTHRQGLINPNFRIDADGSGIAGLRDGSINAMFSGSWDAAAVKEALGDNMGVAALPTYTLNGEEKQMYAYAGTKAVGVNTQSDYMVQAVELAIFLGNEYSQRLHYESEQMNEAMNSDGI